MRKALGGAMRQVGILAAAGLVALDTIVPGFNEDHEKVRRIATGNISVNESGFLSIGKSFFMRTGCLSFSNISEANIGLAYLLLLPSFSFLIWWTLPTDNSQKKKIKQDARSDVHY